QNGVSQLHSNRVLQTMSLFILFYICATYFTLSGDPFYHICAFGVILVKITGAASNETAPTAESCRFHSYASPNGIQSFSFGRMQ
ncbi:MAG: hypothetical protein E7E26_12105, partial [Clostridiales bacterium]|nr:hypothetical protein [Clostridiales bacterium]